MNAQEIRDWLEARLMESLGHHLTVAEGTLTQYNVGVNVPDSARVVGGRLTPASWIDILVQLYEVIYQMLPFCMCPPEEVAPAFRMVGQERSRGNLLRVSCAYSVREQSTTVYVDFMGRVFNPPNHD